MTYEKFWHSLCEEHRGPMHPRDSRTTNSIVHRFRKDLESCGEYVVRANISSGWFAVFPKTWNARTAKANQEGRKGPSLIIYRTTSGDPRDHHVIPYDVVRDLLVAAALTHSEVNGSQRWNLTLKDGKLHVTHLPGTKDVSRYHGAPLRIEGDSAYNSKHIHSDLQARLTVLEGIAREIAVIAKSRSRKLRDSALKRSGGICEACGTDFSAIFGGKGLHALQVHHRRQLALQDAPTLTSTDDLAVVCANCHAIIHADRLNPMSVEALRDQWRTEKSVFSNPESQAQG